VCFDKQADMMNLEARVGHRSQNQNIINEITQKS